MAIDDGVTGPTNADCTISNRRQKSIDYNYQRYLSQEGDSCNTSVHHSVMSRPKTRGQPVTKWNQHGEMSS